VQLGRDRRTKNALLSALSAVFAVNEKGKRKPIRLFPERMENFTAENAECAEVFDV
jgi:hypothetical protein